MIFRVKHILIVGALLVLPHFLFGQIDTTRIDSTRINKVEGIAISPVVLDTLTFHGSQHVTVQQVEAVLVELNRRVRIHKAVETGLNQKDVDALLSNDVGDLAAKLPGATVKSYGGLGGLKTFSLHSMGSSHLSVLLDGVVQSNSQSGQVNLGQIQSDGVSGVKAFTSFNHSLYLPVSAVLAGNVLSIRTFQQKLWSQKYSMKANVKYGSFNRKESYLSFSSQLSPRFSLSAFGKYREADGNYKFNVKNGLTDLIGERQNNDYRDIYFGAQLTYHTKQDYPIILGYKGSLIRQGLPGAVILYNETADERLTTEDHSIYTSTVKGFNAKNFFRLYGSGNLNKLNYFDPTYANNVGSQDVDYVNSRMVVGISYFKYTRTEINWSGGIEETIGALVSSDSSLSNPIRFHTKSYVGANKDFAFGKIQVLLSGQYVNENTRLGTSSNELYKANPMLSFKSKELPKFRQQHGVMYKNTFRMPSFNELYYNYVGNETLLPETAHQFIYSLELVPIGRDRKNLDVRTSIYYNRVNNKIVAIPTKNLFVWSMQNVTNVDVLGGDVSAQFSMKYENFSYKILANYSFQRTVDASAESLNYGDQIAYTPMHTANLDFSFELKSFGFRFSNNYVAGRYALNENIESNLVSGYITSDLTANYTFELKEKNKIKIQANVKNVFNQSYAYVRSFVMPGRNYLISLSYAFN